ncbi:MAG: FTR1 family protein [Gloeomargaritaceae cyanobacterium C42_A2020_066]|nr:FTR1 family protein [Gloeomargaritaceae cyanobacterium C42_A2020_066]
MAVPFNWSASLPALVITLREGVEAALVVGLVLAFLTQSRQPTLKPYVWLGVIGGLGLSLALGGGLFTLLQRVGDLGTARGSALTYTLEAGFEVLAVGLLSWMLVWMTRQSRSLKRALEAQVREAAGAWSLAGLVLTAVAREGFETVVFIAAQWEAGWGPVLGAALGLLLAIGIGVGLFGLGIRLPLRGFFLGMGSFLLFIVAGLVVSALRHGAKAAGLWQQVPGAWVPPCLFPGTPDTPACYLGPLVWNLAPNLPDSEFPGVLLKTLFGYTDHLYTVQAIAYLVFLSLVGGLYYRSLAPASPQPVQS